MIDLLPALFIFYMGLILGFQTAGLRHWKLHKSGWALRILLLAWVLRALIDMHAAAVTTAPANDWLFGLLLLTLGGGLFFWTGETLKSRQLNPAPLRGVDGLITEGPFRFVRHPFYLAYIFFWGAAPAVTMTPGPWIVFCWDDGLLCDLRAAGRGLYPRVRLRARLPRLPGVRRHVLAKAWPPLGRKDLSLHEAPGMAWRN